MASICIGEHNPDDVLDLYPEGSSPEIRIPRSSAVCSLGMSPLIVTGTLRQLLAQHFADPENVTHPQLRALLRRSGGGYRLPADGAQPTTPTGISIETSTRWQPTTAGQRPAIVIKRGAWKFKKLGIGNRAGADYVSGTQYYQANWTGSHELAIFSNEPAEVEIIGWEVSRLLAMYATLISESLDMVSFQVETIGPLADGPKESKDTFTSTITIAYEIADGWALTPEAPRLKQLILRTSGFNDA